MLSASTGSASAAPFAWTSGGDHKSWGQAANWGLPAGSATPGAGDTVGITWNFQDGYKPTIGLADHAAGSIYIGAVGRLDVVANGTFAVGDLSVDGAFNVGQGAVVTVGSALTLGLGKIKGSGTINAATVGVSQSGGTMGLDLLKAATYDMSGGVVNGSRIVFGGSFMLRETGDVTAAGVLEGAAGSTMEQSGGTMNGSVSGISSYTQTGGSVMGSIVTQSYALTGGSANGDITFSDTFTLSDQGAIDWMRLTGGSNAVFEQSGGTMGGIVGIGDTEAMTGIAMYRQTGGDMGGGWIATRSYEVSGGTVNGTVDFSETFALSRDGEVGDVFLNGDGDAAMTQSGGKMGGNVTGIASYDLSDGSIVDTGRVVTSTFRQSGGSIADAVRIDFSTLFDLSDGQVGWGDLIGSADATMTQSGGGMGAAVYVLDEDGEMSSIAKYSQSGGNMNGWVIARTYEASGGNVNAMVEFADLFALSGDAVVGDQYLDGDGDAIITQSGGVMGGEVSAIASYTQSGGTMIRSVATEDYAVSGGAISGQVYFNGLFALSGSGEVTGDAALFGDWSSEMTQSGGTMGGSVRGITNYAQSGGVMSGTAMEVTSYDQSAGTMAGEVETKSYAFSGGAISGKANLATQFTLSDTGTVTSSAWLAGGSAAKVTQSGGTMSGLANGFASYTQSAGVMTGAVATAGTYTLSGGTMSGQATFSTLFGLSGGEVTATGKSANFFTIRSGRYRWWMRDLLQARPRVRQP